MKKIYSYIGGILLTATIMLGISACSPDGFTSPSEDAIPMVSDYADAIKIEVNQETNYVSFSFTGKEVMPIWIIDGKSYSTSFEMKKYYRKAGEYTVDIKIANANGTSDGSITKTFQVNKTIMNGFGGFVYDSPFNLWKSATVAVPAFWYAPGWGQIADPTYTLLDGTYTVALPQATTDTWQAQMALKTNIPTQATTHYDFSAIFTSTTDHPHVMVKLVNSANDEVYYFAQTIALTANEPLCFWKNNLPGIDADNLKLVLDFGGNAAASVITIEGIVLKDHANDDGTVVPKEEQVPDPKWSAVDSADNLWHGASFTNTFFYAPGWNAIANPALLIAASQYTLTFPEATTDQWQNQVSFITDHLALSATNNYDFRVAFTASKEIKNVTIKLAQVGDDETFLFVLNKDLSAGEEMIVKAINTPGVDMSQVKLVLDFGGNPANTTVVIKDLIIQIHKD